MINYYECEILQKILLKWIDKFGATRRFRTWRWAERGWRSLVCRVGGPEIKDRSRGRQEIITPGR